MTHGNRIPLDEALATAKANAFGRMLGRGADNRLEPECWPHVAPSFHFTKNQKFFAIGSCFAKNIRKRLAVDGYNVLGGVGAEDNRRNRYTPPAIFQELNWARQILERDDVVRDSDIEPLLLQLGPDRWTDIWCRSETARAPTLAEALAARTELYSHFRDAFFADVVIITLGLIEAWWDEVSGTYVEFDVPWARRADRTRFEFERLSFETCKAYVRKTLELLLDGRRQVLITTSPVVLARTFTPTDIILANSMSKSVLRAVAGEVAAELPRVDYFPSYEIATLTRRPEVWEDDLIHIQPAFVARIMQHVTSAYVPGTEEASDRAVMRLPNLVEAAQWPQAEALYESSREVISNSRDPAVLVAAMRLAQRRGSVGCAVEHALRVDGSNELLYRNHGDWMFDVWRVLRSFEDHKAEAASIRERLIAVAQEHAQILLTIFTEQQRNGDDEALRDLIGVIQDADVHYPVIVHKIAPLMQAIGMNKEALVLVERQLSSAPQNAQMLMRKARLLLAANRTEDAVDVLGSLRKVEPDDAWAQLTLARALGRLNRYDDALAIVDDHLSRREDDASAHAYRAKLLARLGQNELAAQCARTARDLAAGDAKVLREIEPLLGAS